MHPKQLTEALMAASGAEVVLARVTGGRCREGRVEGVEVEGGRFIPGDVVVLCMGVLLGENEIGNCTPFFDNT